MPTKRQLNKNECWERIATTPPFADMDMAAAGPVRVARPRPLRRFGPLFLVSLAFLATLLTGCTRTHSERGVEPAWRALPAESLIVGSTTRSQLLAMLGPPSQVITQTDGEIFYYLHEESESRGLILLLYNTSQTDTRYDRAIFFLNADGVLVDYAVRDGGAAE